MTLACGPQENRGFVSGQASSGLERIRELEDRLAASEAQRGELSGAVKHLQQEVSCRVLAYFLISSINLGVAAERSAEGGHKTK